MPGTQTAQSESTQTTAAPNQATRSSKGFASMDPDKRREIASKGGKAAHAKGTAHEFDSAEASAAGQKGGVSVSSKPGHMAEIGRRGGQNRGHGATKAPARVIATQADKDRALAMAAGD